MGEVKVAIGQCSTSETLKRIRLGLVQNTGTQVGHRNIQVQKTETAVSNSWAAEVSIWKAEALLKFRPRSLSDRQQK